MDTDEDPPTLDHIRPKSKGGTNGIKNMVLVHHSCNQMKGDMYDYKESKEAIYQFLKFIDKLHEKGYLKWNQATKNHVTINTVVIVGSHTALLTVGWRLKVLTVVCGATLNTKNFHRERHHHLIYKQKSPHVRTRAFLSYNVERCVAFPRH